MLAGFSRLMNSYPRCDCAHRATLCDAAAVAPRRNYKNELQCDRFSPKNQSLCDTPVTICNRLVETTVTN